MATTSLVFATIFPDMWDKFGRPPTHLAASETFGSQPEITFWAPPSKSQLLEVTSEWKGVHSRLTWEELLDVATSLQVKVSHEDIKTSLKGAQASLTPRPEGGWLARIDPRPTPFEERTDTCSAAGRSAFRLAHEFGHIYFSDRRTIPHTPVNSYWHASPYNSDEEEYCDQLAGLALVGPEAAHCETAAEVVYAAQELDVPVAAMINALSVYREHAVGLFHVPMCQPWAMSVKDRSIRLMLLS